MYRNLSILAALLVALGAPTPGGAAAQSDTALAPPAVAALVRTASGEVGVTLAGAVEASGYNVYRDRTYVTTVRPPLGVRQFEVDAGSRAGDYCLVAFDESVSPDTGETVTRYSRCGATFALDAADSASEGSESAGPPTPPSGLRAVVYSPGVIELFWERSRDDGRVVAYRVTRDGEEVANRDGRSHFESGLSLEREYEFLVTAIDDEGEESEPAMLLLLAVDDEPPAAGSGEGEPPAPPGDLRGVVYSPGVAEIFWDRSPDEASLAGYELLRDGERVVFRRGRSFFEPRLAVGRSYEYTLFAVGRDGARSAPLTLALRPGLPPPPASGFDVYLTPERLSITEGDPGGVTVEVVVQRADGADAPASLQVLDASSVPLEEVAGELRATFDRTLLPGTGAIESASLNVVLPIDMGPRLSQQRTLFVRVGDGEEAVDTPLTVDIEPVDAPDVYLLIGQSNMEGYSEVGSKRAGPGEPDEPVDRVRQLHVQSSNPRFFAVEADFLDESVNVHDPLFIRAEDPLHDRLWPGRPAKSGTAIGPGLSFGKAALATTERDVYLVPAAWGATGFCGVVKGDVAWNAAPTDVPELGGTWLLDRALVRLRIALRETGGILRGILWHQGGADSNELVCGERYAENIVAMVERLRREAFVDARGPDARGDDAAVPFIVATQSRGADERGDYSIQGPPKVLVDSAQRRIATLVPHADVVINDDLVPPAYPCGQSSCVHFGAAALREQGNRFHAALERVRRRHAEERRTAAD